MSIRARQARAGGLRLLGLAACAVMPWCGTTQANTYTWTGASGNWGDATNWSGGTVPGSADTALLNNATTLTVDNSNSYSATALYIGTASGGSGVVDIGPGASLTLARLYDAANITTTNVVTNGTINQTGGAISVSTQLYIGGQNGTTGAPGATGTYNLSGGTFTATSSVANTRIARNGSTGIVNQTGGTWASNGLFISTLSVAGPPAYNSPATYSISGTSTMTLTGRLYVDAVALGGDTNPSAGGQGTFNVTGSNAIITTYGFDEGNTGVGGNLNFVADANGISTINVSANPAGGANPMGEVDLAGNLSVNLSALTASPSVMVLISNSSATPVVGTFVGDPQGTAFGAYTLSYDYGPNGNEVALIAVPEPTAAMAVGPLLALLALRPRRAQGGARAAQSKLSY